ncbi:transposase [Lactobacillus hamsteri DSM 5661 = JCM 6256]|uniref:Transposase n=2 Tax=Lactobacillus hamsteri TaxID=96565 RepID=A0A0R1Y509_9LACO|nr:IS110 family transposase [Lactobacillus hamsteri]KRM37472.1 transposase [Lactobacillus hamsteri DSM 5661 = JCM 6256]
MNIIGIDVSKGESHATLIDKEFGETNFVFRHNKSGFQKLKSFMNENTIVIFETTGIYSAQLSRFLQNCKVKTYELNPLEASLRMASMRRNKTDAKDSLKLALLGVTQLSELERNHRIYFDSQYQNLHILALRYRQLIKTRTRIINHLRASLELTFPELNSIFKSAHEIIALQIFKQYCHPDFLVGLSIQKMTNNVYLSVSKHIHKDLIQEYCQKVWLAAKDSYPAVNADSQEIEIIYEYCDEIQQYNKTINWTKKKLIRLASSLENFKIICSIPGTGQLNTSLLLGLAGDISRFDNYKQLNAYLGLDLNRYQSGQYEKHDTINRRGSSQGRAVETDMIRSMLRNQNKIQNHLIDYYYKLKKPPFNKHDKVALIACANHLNRTIINLVHTHQVYDYQKATH